MIDMHTLAGEPRTVIRPHADWHLFKLQRPMYNDIYDWYTIEGPALRLHNGRYYCFFSGGAWERENYGISYVIAEHPLGPYQRLPDETVPLLQSVADHVIGPGHNSFTESSDGQHEYIVYHAWDTAMTARRMCVDRLHWEGDTPVVDGPTWTPQRLPDV
jgi:GH43 family beta-xylosidase